MWRSPVLHLQILLGTAFLFGGGGSAYGLSNLAVHLVALACLAVNGPRAWQFFRDGPRMLVALVTLSIMLPLVQAIPLPSAVWQTFPGRELVIEAYRAAGVPADSWFQISMNRGRTLVALAGTFAPAAMIIIGSTLTRAELGKLALTFVGLALFDLAVGFVQLSAANTIAMPYDELPAANVLHGLLANRNSHAVMLICALAMLVAAPLPVRDLASAGLKTAIGSLLAVGVLLTQSRTGMTLLALTLLMIAIAAARHVIRSGGAGRIRHWVSLGMATFVVMAAVASFQFGGRVADSLERFKNTETDRPEMWEDGLYAAQHYWPVGSGTGTFDEVFQVDESLEHVSPRRAGRAHNEYIEVAIESGLFGLLVMAGWIVWITMAVLRRDPQPEWQWRAWAGLAILCIALQSVLDYPLRNQLMLTVFGLLVAALVRRERRALK